MYGCAVLRPCSELVHDTSTDSEPDSLVGAVSVPEINVPSVCSVGGVTPTPAAMVDGCDVAKAIQYYMLLWLQVVL
jgi:hypothetical protein